MANLLGTTVNGSLLIGPSGTANAYDGAATGKLYFGNQVSDSPTYYHITTNMANYNGNYSKLDIRWYTGQRFFAHTVYGGFRFYEITNDAELFSVGRGDSHVRVVNNLYAGGLISTTAASSRFGNVLVGDGTYKNTIKPIDDTNLNIHTPSGAVYFDTFGQASGSFRAPIFYDSNDTNFYLDPNAGKSLRIAGGIEQNNLIGRPFAQWGQGGAATGAVVIKFPGNANNYGMVHAVVDIYEYNGNNVCTIVIGGHNWGNRWYSYGANMVGFTDKPVRLAFKDGKYAIVIGNDSSSWSYGQVVLRKIQNGSYYAGVMDVASGYTVGIEPESSTWISEDLRGLRVGGPVSATNISTGVNASHIVQRDASGYIYANHINFSTSESENPTISSFITSNGDGWSRKSSLAHVRNQLGNYGNWITTDGRAYPRRSDGTNINFYWDGQGGQPTWLWGSNNGVDFYVWNPSNFSVSYASSAGNADTLDGLDSSRFLYTTTGTFSGDWNTLTDSDLEIRLVEVHNITGGAHSNYPTGLYTYGSVLGWQLSNSTFKLYSSHTGDLAFQTGWNNDGYSGWRTIIHSANIGSQSVNYASSAGNADTLDGLNSSVFVRNDVYNSADAGLQVFRNIGSIDGSWPSSDHTFGLENSDAGNIVINFHRAGYTSHNLWYNGSQFRFNQVVTSTADFRAPIFYDSNDTAFYVDPNSESRLYRLNVGGSGHSLENTEAVLKFRNTASPHNYIVSQGSTWGSWNQWIRYVGDYNTWRIGTYDEAQESGTSVWRLAGRNRSSNSEINYIVAGPRGAWGSDDRVVLHNPYARYDGGSFNGDGTHYQVITAANIGSQSVSNANTVGGYAPTIAYGSNNVRGKVLVADPGSGNISTQNPESYSGEVRLGAAWDRGGVYASGVLSLSTGSSQIDFVFSNSTRAFFASDGNLWMSWAGAYISTLLDAKQNASTAINTGNIASQTVGQVNQTAHNRPAILLNASGTSDAGGSLGMQQVTGEGWTGIFVDYEPYTGWGLWHDNPNNYFSFTAEASTGSIRSFTVPSRESGNRTAYEKLRIDQNNGDIIVGRNGYAQSSFRAPIFYDSNDTAFYGDFNSRSVLNSLQLGSAPSDNSNLKLDVQGNMAIRGANGLYFGVSTNNYNSWTTRIYASGSTQYFNAQQFIFDNQGYGGTTFATINSSGLFVTNNYVSNYFNVESSRAVGENGHVGMFRSRQSAATNYIPFSFQSQYGDHSWGQVARFHIEQSGADRPSIQFSSGTNNTRWNIGYCTGSDDHFRITQNMGHRPDMSGANDGWGTPRLIMYTNGIVDVPQGYVSNGNPWGTANTAFFPNGITTAGGTNWIYGFTYIGNAPSNGAGHEFTTSGTQYSTGSITTPLFLVNNHSDNTRGYRIHNTSGSSVSAMFTNSANALVIGAGALDQVQLNKKTFINGAALGVNVAASATAGRIDASNDIVAYSSSDERLKHNIAPIENALDKVKSLTGVEFDWKPEYKHAHGYEGHDTGIIAQQVEAVMPSAVRTNDTGFLAVRYEKLIGLLIEANKELAARVEELEKKIG